MSRKTLSTDKAPAAIGPYSQGVAAGGLVFTSMQIALDPASGEMVGQTAPEQARRCLENIRGILEAGGGSLSNVVKTTLYLTDISTYAAVNEIYAEFFSDNLPARGIAEVSALPRGALIAVEAVASME